MTQQLGVATIGYAFMGKAHSQAWRNVAAYFDVPAIARRVLVGRDQTQVRDAAERLGWDESAVDWRAAIARDDIDIVDICAPGRFHTEMALAALAAGKHVIVEKPLANSLADAERMAAAAEEAASRGQHAIVNFNYRRVPALALAQQLVADGRIGRIRQVRASYLQDWLADPATPMSWRLRAEDAGSGALGDLGSHLVDLVAHLTGEDITSISGSTRTFIGERPGGDSGDGGIKGTGGGALEQVTVDDAAWATGSLSGGGMLQLEVSRVALGRKNAMELQIYGDRGSIRFDLERLNELEFFDAGDSVATQAFRRILVTDAQHPWVGAWWPDGHVIGWEHTFVHQIAAFLTGIRDDVPANPSFTDGVRAQRVLDAIARSAASGSAVVELPPAT